MKIKIVLCAYLIGIGANLGFSGPLLEKFKEKQQPNLVEFGTRYLQNVGPHVFYPFGGPDVTYPLLLFPNFEILTLMGLEPAKPVEETPVSLDDDALSNLSSLYRRSFFITDQMASGVRNVATVILKQLENLGATDITIQAIDGKKNAVQVKFAYNDKTRIIRYYKAGLDNDQIDLEFLSSLKPFDVVLFKAASYLPHQKKFKVFRNFMLENAKVFVQDSTGIPYEYLKNDFELDLHGQYLMPYKFPGGFEQLNFKEYSKTLNNPVLNICFGYGCNKVPTNILIASRKETANL
ncbi:MAG: hypothetical protein KBD04_03320 [Proteobacteria bacterium]|nr:hypothetical protein [Pseudomonadota bacterium]